MFASALTTIASNIIPETEVSIFDTTRSTSILKRQLFYLEVALNTSNRTLQQDINKTSNYIKIALILF